ncbi:RHS repeat domain-containing protein [Weeksella virosa]|uniref:RHS repeat domain-containing protein n=2 Tax=Pseudomonadati TaxID=3379134 RepID=UPI00288906D1|nr:RHS repeat-associated core domain-containing protein [Weeksella virosa]
MAQYINSSDGQAELLSSRVWQAELAEETQAAPKLYHYVCDHLGTPQLLMNQGQDVVWEAKAKAWGETRVISRPAADEQVINNHRFQGQYYDAETSLHYNTFRYYDPELGRFISQDPIGLMGGINLYQYAPNPVEWVDPLGWKTRSSTLQRLWKDYVGQPHVFAEIHHGFPEEFADRFKRLADIDVNNPKFFFNLSPERHRLTRGRGVHTNSSRVGKNWNKVFDGLLDYVEKQGMDKETAKDFLEKRLRDLARKERIGKYSADAVKNRPCK